ncbi:MAG TPA: DUF4062 domain-containing protein [Pyrinomonadaceae bacterium]|jgi:hypothetical protein
MAQKKKLQVFISSTFDDLKSERQAAVEAILTAGHIPAGMELFTSGDESQMKVIKRWIDESDVFLLILGGRYGSIEPKSKKSYIHLEYEYAIKQGKPYFALVITEDYLKERIKQLGADVIEQDNPQKLREFRATVLKKISEFWDNSTKLQLQIHKKMAEFSRNENLVGWIPGNEAINTGALAEEILRLTKENAELREQIAKIDNTSTFTGSEEGEFQYVFEKLNRDLVIPVNVYENFFDQNNHHATKIIKSYFAEINLLHLLCAFVKNNMFFGSEIVNSFLREAARYNSESKLENDNQYIRFEFPQLSGELFTLGLIMVENDPDIRYSTKPNLFSDKMTRFLFWIDLKKLIPDDFLFELIDTEN